MTEFIVGGIFTIVVFVAGFVMGTLSGKGELKERVEKVLKDTVAKQARTEGGPVKSLTPEELAKVKSREIIDKYGL